MTFHSPFEKLAHRIRSEHETRLGELRSHGWKALLIGVLVLGFGGNHAIEDAVGPWVRLVLGVGAVFAGSVLLWTTRDRSESFERLTAQLVAVRILIGWDLFMAAGLVWTYGEFEGWVFTRPWESAPLGQPALFPLPIYVALAFMLHLHSRMIREVRRELP